MTRDHLEPPGPATDKAEALAALERASRAQAEVKAERASLQGVVTSLSRMLEENHFSLRVARAFGLEDDRR